MHYFYEFDKGFIDGRVVFHCGSACPIYISAGLVAAGLKYRVSETQKYSPCYNV